jgi:phosphatidylserine decarboxylase
MAREGFKFAVPPLAVGVLLVAFGWTWTGAALLLVGAFVLWFFRDPERRIPDDPALVVSPADGRVTHIVAEERDGRPGRRISIFLSIFDVHVNRTPAAGTLRRIEYRRGKFLNAMRAAASAENEQNVLRIETGRGEIEVKQIAGWIARRILCWKREGDTVARGERFGMIRFGSRVDLWLPGDPEILVQTGRHVSGGSTPLARWK